MSECCVCLENRSLLKLECKHPLCEYCKMQIQNQKCPLCRQQIKIIIEKRFRKTKLQMTQKRIIKCLNTRNDKLISHKNITRLDNHFIVGKELFNYDSLTQLPKTKFIKIVVNICPEILNNKNIFIEFQRRINNYDDDDDDELSI